MTIETRATVREILRRAPQVVSFRVVPEKSEDFKAGQWLFVTCKVSDRELCKPLSISNAPGEAGYLEFTKKLTTSDFSSALSSLKVGDSVLVKYPQGNFIFKGDAPKIAFCSGGIGITPIRSILRDIADRGLNTDSVLLYGNNTEADIVFKDDLDRMQSQNPRLKIVHLLCNPQAGWQGRTGFISDAVIREEMPDFLERRFYLCGPPPMVEALKKILLEKCGLPKNQFVIEGFAGYA